MATTIDINVATPDGDVTIGGPDPARRCIAYRYHSSVDINRIVGINAITACRGYVNSTCAAALCKDVDRTFIVAESL